MSTPTPTTTKPSILLLGASGALGTPVTLEFARHVSSFSQISILTTPSRAPKFAHLASLGISLRTGSLFSASSYAGFDILVSMVGNSLMGQQPEIFRAAVEGGVGHIYASEYNSDLSQAELRGMRYFADKYAVRGWVEREFGGEGKGVRFTYLETGLFTEWVADTFHGVDVEARTVRAYGRGDAVVTVTSIPDIAKYLVLSTLLPFPPSSPPIRTLRVSGETLTFAALVLALQQALGPGVEFDVRYLDPAEAKRNEQEARERGDEWAEKMWSIKPLAASGYGTLVGGGVDDGRFAFRAESARETFERMFGGKGRRE